VSTVAAEPPRSSGSGRGSLSLGGAPSGVAPGLAITYLSLIVLLPLAALAWVTGKGGWESFKAAVTAPDAVAAIKLTLVVSLLVVLINGFFGTLVAWVMVRDEFRGKAFLNSLIDLPFALPTIVAGLTLLTLYGPNSPIGINVAYTRTAVLLALLFETLPFVIRSVQPVLLEMDREVEDAAGSLGATRFTVFRRVILPTILPAIVSGAALAFARAIGEFGSVVLMSGNIPFSTEVASVHIFAQVQSDNPDGAAALAVLMLGLALGILLAMGALERWGGRHDR
jgi:sulfate transport system permease protein